MTELEVGVAEVVSYLTRAGWRRGLGGSLAEIWDNPQHEGVRVLVPKEQRAPDFVNRITMLTHDLAQLEQRHSRQISEDIARQFLDVTDLRAENPDLISVTIPLRAGHAMLDSARQLVVAAAGATIRRQGHFGKSMPRRARQHVNAVRLGHTREGSYVIPLISAARIPDPPSQDEPPHLELAVEEAAFDRRVLVTMARALDVLAEMVVRRDQPPTRAEVHDAVGEGVSYELCTAVHQIINTDEITDLSIDFNWALAARPPVRAPSHVGFPVGAIERVSAVLEMLRAVDTERQSVIYGLTTHLSSGTADVGGRVGVEAVVDGKLRTVWMDLGLQDYETAIACHKRRLVVARGTLKAAPGKRVIMEPAYFGPDTSAIPTEETSTAELAEPSDWQQ